VLIKTTIIHFEINRSYCCIKVLHRLGSLGENKLTSFISETPNEFEAKVSDVGLCPTFPTSSNLQRT
jgi:hypothetical protein